jgi:putative copper export protein
MNSEALQMALTLDRLINYGGFVLWAGTLAFWSLIWPGGHRDRRLFGLALAGAGLLTVGSVAEPLIRLWLGGQTLEQVAPPLAGAAVLVRLAVLIGSAFFLADLVAAAVTGARRIVAIIAVVVVAATMAIQPGAAGERGTVLLTLGAVAYLLATAAWLGGLGGLALVFRPGGKVRPADHLLTRFSPVAMLSLVVLVVIGAAAAVATSGAPDGPGDVRFWLVLAAKIGFLAALLLVVSMFRRYAARVAFRQLYHLPAGGARTVQARGRLTLVFGMEVAVAFAVLITTGLLMMVAQTG